MDELPECDLAAGIDLGENDEDEREGGSDADDPRRGRGRHAKSRPSLGREIAAQPFTGYHRSLSHANRLSPA
jgi:hypothetical protein